jgi:phage repressor protein C with HTH and peptisase S24 domain
MYALPHICRMSNTESLLRKNLEWLIAQRKTNPHELQRVTGVPQPTIHRILTGESTDPRTKTLQPLAEFFGLSVSNLRDQDLAAAARLPLPQATSRPFDENVRPALLGTRPIPVISAVQAGALRDMESPYEPGDGYAVEYTGDASLSRWTFGLDVEGKSMQPRFQEGDRLIVDPERPGQATS